VSEFEQNLSVINELVALAETMSGEGRTGTTLAELSARLQRSLNDLVRVVEILGIQPGSWSEPTLYRLEQIIEAGTRHEVARRMGQEET
jgi:hypothetical protein